MYFCIKTLLILAGFAALSACSPAPTVGSSDTGSATVQAAEVAVPAPQLIADESAGIQPGTYTDSIDGTTARIEIGPAGKPTAYSFGSYRPRSLSRQGQVIMIDQARLTITKATPDGFSGRFVLNGETTEMNFKKV